MHACGRNRSGGHDRYRKASRFITFERLDLGLSTRWQIGTPMSRGPLRGARPHSFCVSDACQAPAKGPTTAAWGRNVAGQAQVHTKSALSHPRPAPHGSFQMLAACNTMTLARPLALLANSRLPKHLLEWHTSSDKQDLDPNQPRSPGNITMLPFLELLGLTLLFRMGLPQPKTIRHSGLGQPLSLPLAPSHVANHTFRACR